MTKTLTTERLREILERRSPSLRWGEAEQIAAELLANREAQPVGFYTTVSGRKGVVWHNGTPEDDTAIYTAPPAPAVPRVTEIPEAATLTNINQLCPLDNNLSQTDFATGWNDCRQYAITNDGVPHVAQGWHSAAQGWNACRAAMLAQPVSQGCKLPDNVREALTLALQAMEFMGDTLNNIDAVCTEDVEYVTPAFAAARGLLAAAPEGGNG